MWAASFGWRDRVKTPLRLPTTRVTPCEVIKSAKFHTCSPMKMPADRISCANRSFSGLGRGCVGGRHARGEGEGEGVRVRAHVKGGVVRGKVVRLELFREGHSGE